MRWLWERINVYSELAAMAASLVIAPILLITVEDEWLKLLLMSSLSTAVVLIVTWLAPATEEATLDHFFKKVNPPGFWRRTATRLGADPGAPVTELKRGIWLVLSVSMTIFLLLVGIGRLLLPSPEIYTLVSWGYVITGLASIKLWWHWFSDHQSGDDSDNAQVSEAIPA